MRWNQLIAALAVCTMLVPTVGYSQPGFLGSLDGGEPIGEVVETSGVFVAGQAGKPGRIYVTAKMAPDWHIYSITQADGGPVRSRIKIPASSEYRIGPFVATAKPASHPEAAFNNLITETHEGTITWVALLELSPGIDPAQLEIKGTLLAQACAHVCRPPTDYKFTARAGAAPQIAGEPTPPPIPAGANAPPPPAGPASGAPPAPAGLPVPGGLPALGGPPVPGLPAAAFDLMPAAKSTSGAGSLGMYEPPYSHLKLSGRFEPSTIAPGTSGKLLLTADIAPGWHVYGVAAPQARGNQATLFVFDETNGWAVGLPTADRAPKAPHETAAEAASGLLPFFENQVTWSVDVHVPATAQPGSYSLKGAIGFQTCDVGTKCDPPGAVKFEVPVGVAAASVAAPVPVRFGERAAYQSVVAALRAVPPAGPVEYDIAQLRPQSQSSAEASSLVAMLGTGLLAGFILNFMPCVLPVIGLKVLSFVEQGGHDRRRVFLLNLWYSLGIVSVFLVLATIPVVLRVVYGTRFGWGQQFSYDGFNITLVAIVFVMALSFLGVWEIPIPGFAGSRGAQTLANKEGAFGAFVKGVITTVLATPCSGPFLGTAVAFALRESVGVTYAMFTAMGLGMAAPYLLIGVRPQLVKILPKPGEWMDTFKQVMGFVLVGTVIWLMVPIHGELLLPTLVLLAGLSVACWWIGRTPGYAELPQKLMAWGQGAAVAGIIGWLAFAMPQVTDPLPWKEFAMKNFVDDVNSGKTVLVEFTAPWCASCKVLKAANLDRSSTKKRVEANGVVVYEVNIDEASPQVRELFETMQPSKGVPLVAIFPANKKYEPIRFGDGYTQSQILDALDRAGPSKGGIDSKPQTAQADGVRLGMQ